MKRSVLKLILAGVLLAGAVVLLSPLVRSADPTVPPPNFDNVQSGGSSTAPAGSAPNFDNVQSGSSSAPAGDTAAIQSLGDLLSAVYDYSLKLVGLCVFGMFTYAGFQMLVNPFDTGTRAKAIKIIKDAVVGAILLFSAVVILNTINPDLAGQDPKSIPVLKGGPASGATTGTSGAEVPVVSTVVIRNANNALTFVAAGGSCGTTALPCRPGFSCQGGVCSLAATDAVPLHGYCYQDTQCAGNATCVDLYDFRDDPGMVRKCCAPNEIETRSGGTAYYCRN